jgi:predicted nucleic acid-binding protein
MILADSSVWIDYFNGVEARHTNRLNSLMAADERVVTADLIVCEVLQGFAAERDFRAGLRVFEGIPCYELGGEEAAIEAAANYRKLRSRGTTVRNTIDGLIASFCIRHRVPLLHHDRDFEPFERHLGLKVVT